MPSAILLHPPSFLSFLNIWQVTFSVGTAGMYSKSFSKIKFCCRQVAELSIAALFQIFQTTVTEIIFLGDDCCHLWGNCLNLIWNFFKCTTRHECSCWDFQQLSPLRLHCVQYFFYHYSKSDIKKISYYLRVDVALISTVENITIAV